MYVGSRDDRGCQVHVLVGDNPRWQYRLRHVGGLSPSGFEWGYGGQGPSDTALSLLVDALGEDDLVGGHANAGSDARTLARAFEQEIVAQLPRHRDWVLTQAEILAWSEEHLA